MSNASSEPQDNREQPRYDVAIRVHIAQLGEVNGAISRNLSTDGIYIESSFPYPVGSSLPLRLIHPRTAEQIPILCQVVRHFQSTQKKTFGMGLKFVSVDETLAKNLRDFLLEVMQAIPAKQDEESKDETTTNKSTPKDIAQTRPQPKSLAELVPLNAIPSIIKSVDAETLHPALVHILKFINGQRTSDELACFSGFTLVETLASLNELLQLGIIDIKLDTSASVNSSLKVKESTKTEKIQEQFKFQKASDCMTEAIRSERAGRISEAVNLLEHALTLNPKNISDIYVRLVRISINPLKDTEKAQIYLDVLKLKYPKTSDIPNLEKELAKENKERNRLNKIALKDQLTSISRQFKIPKLKRSRQILFGVVSLGFMALIAWNLWLYVIPHGPQPTTISIKNIIAILPSAQTAELFRGRLYIKVNLEWRQWKKAEKKDALKKLQSWSKNKKNIDHIIISQQSEPIVLAKIKGSKITIYR